MEGKKFGVGILLLTSIVVICSFGVIIRNGYTVKEQIASVENLVKEGGTNSSLEEYLSLQFGVDGKSYKCLADGAHFYEDTSLGDEKEIEEPILASEECATVQKGNVTYYCYLLKDGRIAFSDEVYAPSSFVKVRRVAN